MKAARDLAARALVPLRPVQRRLAGDLSGIGVNYRFTGEPREGRRRGMRADALTAGDRVPDLELWDERPPVRLYELLRKPGYALFVFVSATRLGAYRGSLGSLVQEVNDAYGGEIVRPHVVLDEGAPQAVEVGAPVLIDFKGQFGKNLAPRTAAFCFRRPPAVGRPPFARSGPRGAAAGGG